MRLGEFDEGLGENACARSRSSTCRSIVASSSAARPVGADAGRLGLGRHALLPDFEIAAAFRASACQAPAPAKQRRQRRREHAHQPSPTKIGGSALANSLWRKAGGAVQNTPPFQRVFCRSTHFVQAASLPLKTLMSALPRHARNHAGPGVLPEGEGVAAVFLARMAGDRAQPVGIAAEGRQVVVVEEVDRGVDDRLLAVMSSRRFRGRCASRRAPWPAGGPQLAGRRLRVPFHVEHRRHRRAVARHVADEPARLLAAAGRQK